MKPTITLVDGYKDSGRSAVARTLADHLEAVHFVADRGTTPSEYIDVMKFALNDIQHVVIERSWHFERFCKTIGQGSYIRPEHSRMLDRLALARDGYIIKCIPELDVMIKNAKARNAEDFELNHLTEQANLWQKYAVPLPTHEFVDTDEPELLLGAVNESCANDGPGIGMWNPGNVYLIVGERAKAKKKSGLIQGVSFCDVNNDLSFWLSKQLEDADIPEYKLYWINPIDINNDWTTDEFVKHLKPIYVFSIGKEAEDWCIKHELNTTRVAHPLYHRQFYNNHPYPLADYLSHEIHV